MSAVAATAMLPAKTAMQRANFTKHVSAVHRPQAAPNHPHCVQRCILGAAACSEAHSIGYGQSRYQISRCSRVLAVHLTNKHQGTSTCVHRAVAPNAAAPTAVRSTSQERRQEQKLKKPYQAKQYNQPVGIHIIDS
jgi:hypothetical protein